MDRKTTLINFLDDDKFPPLSSDEIMLMLDIPPDNKEELNCILGELVDEGYAVKSSKRKYASPRKLGYVCGKYSSTERGFGFVLNDSGDLFIAPADTMGAMHGDDVMAKVTLKGSDTKRAEGVIVKIITRANREIVGTFSDSRNFGFVTPDERKIGYDIFVSKKKFKNAKSGQKVVVKITKWPTANKKPEGEITKVLGYPWQNGIDIESVMIAHNLDDSFNQAVQKQCENVCEVISQADIDSRQDFRGDNIITIDGKDSRDFDDAVCVTVEDGVYTLGVHIADVAHYVTENSPLDREALRRGTSVYFPGKVVPMLPPKLSNGICSLNPHEDRLTLSVIMKIAPDGSVIDHTITEGIINSKERMTYDDVTAILDGDEELTSKYAHIYEMLVNMKSLAAILRKKRQSNGSIDFDFPETKIVVDENGKVTDVYKYESGVSNQIIEEFMLCANKTVAEQFFWAELPFVYRVHEKPTKEKITDFNNFIKGFGYKLPQNNEPHPGEFANLLKKVKGTDNEMIISKVMLRSLMKARYHDECLGHFGLSFTYYCHFTSPIRRYPDLAIHRIIKEFLRGGISDKRISYYSKFVKDASLKSSEAEINAMDAERCVDDMKKAEYMHSHIGESYDAIISSVTNFGFFAELENGIEGLVRLVDLDDDYYIFDETNLTLVGEHTLKKFKIGDKLNVTVANADPIAKQIDFIPTL